ncbi:hypothetical protein [Pseudorhodoferax sp.]|uniref:hypothetical protein n=1 Tax=Pseudorhodoferax sp. TaxID=1993553 RepID=UPI0039E4ACA9
MRHPILLRAVLARGLAALCMLGALLAWAGTAQAEANHLPPADEQALRALVLREDTANRVLAAMAESKHAGIETGSALPDSVDAWARQIDANPKAAQLLARHKLGAREFVLNALALMRASVAAEAQAKDLHQAGTNAANVAFAKARQAHIQAAFFGGDEDEEDQD